ncbi:MULTISPECIES: AMP-binding protein [Micrococcaceae]|uniref:AMP-binding protein n=1 Tax=Micrococcaceae TaxID=1268 RepID=UPI00184F48EF|nr:MULTISPECIES: AMP-binding protein [Micrococcaceae]MBB5750799.1 fatty-acyl-CoA synthase [Micrococcus sp. TA1]HRO30340.1 AMP-binding protein [Citricoccus sp.]HRO93347.1 AMP-binding protein [Citricoccus sp.]
MTQPAMTQHPPQAQPGPAPAAPADVHAASTEPLTPLGFLGRAAAVFPDREAVVYGARRSTYREFAAEVQQLARAVRARIQPGETVTVIAPNIPAMLMAHFAVPLAGGVLSPLNPRLTARELAYILEHSEARVVFADGDVVATVRDVVGNLPQAPLVVEIVDTDAGHAGPVDPDAGSLTYEDFLAQGSAGPELPWRVADEQAPITLNYTSGTTGPPKGALYTHRGAYLAAEGAVFHNGYTGATRYLWTLPMFHCNGWCTPWAVTSAAGTHVCLRAVRQDAIWDAFDHEGITHLCGAPIVCAMIHESERARPLDRELRMTTAGAAPPPSVIEALESLNITPVHVYGLTEVYGPFTICEPQPAWARLPAAERARLMARQGVPMVHAGEVAVMDADLNRVPADGETLGEVVLRGNGVMKEYFKNPEATAEAFRGGWYHTGDLGVMYPDGYIQLMDRAKDIIISGGENISSIEVEGVLHAHPKVSDVAVVGVQDDRWGERPVAFVVTEAGAQVTADELRAHCRQGLAGFKVPDRVEFVQELPRTATGKIRKNTLRALQDGDGAPAAG